MDPAYCQGMKTKSILLCVSLLAFAVGFSDLQENIVFWLGRPVGAIAFVAYFILMLLEKEFALFDETDGANVKRFQEIKTRSSLQSESPAPVLCVSGAR